MPEELKTEEKEDNTIYKAMMNREEQYSSWRVYRENPLGWRGPGIHEAKTEYLA